MNPQMIELLSSIDKTLSAVFMISVVLLIMKVAILVGDVAMYKKLRKLRRQK